MNLVRVISRMRFHIFNEEANDNSKSICTFATETFQTSSVMTTVELRTSIVAELDQMSVEMLESVSHYVHRLRRHTRVVRRTVNTKDKREAAMLFVKNLSVQGIQSVPADERGIDALVEEKYDKQ